MNGVPDEGAPQALIRLVRNAAETYERTREVEELNSLGEREIQEEVEIVELYYWNPSTQPLQSPTGKRFEARSQAICIPDQDIREDDKLDLDGTEFKVLGVDGRPHGTEPAFLRIEITEI